jgi:hypothetical protein
MNLGKAVNTVVYGNVGSILVDLSARLKACGHTTNNSSRNFCLYCRSPLPVLAAPKGYLHGGQSLMHYYIDNVSNNYLIPDFVRRKGPDVLAAKLRWLNASEVDSPSRTTLYEEHGVQFNILDTLPNWYSPSRAPIDAMHLFYLNIMPHVFKQVIVAPGLLERARRSPHAFVDPAKLFDDCLQRAYYPSSISRLPAKVCNV